MNPGVDSFFYILYSHFGTINKWQNGEQNLIWNVYYWFTFTEMPNLQLFVNFGLRMTEVKTQLNTEIAKSTAS